MNIKDRLLLNAYQNQEDSIYSYYASVLGYQNVRIEIDNSNNTINFIFDNRVFDFGKFSELIGIKNNGIRINNYIYLDDKRFNRFVN